MSHNKKLKKSNLVTI